MGTCSEGTGKGEERTEGDRTSTWFYLTHQLSVFLSVARRHLLVAHGPGQQARGVDRERGRGLLGPAEELLHQTLLSHVSASLIILRPADPTHALSEPHYLLLEDDGGLQTGHDVLEETTGGGVELQLPAGHYVRVQQLHKIRHLLLTECEQKSSFFSPPGV